MGFALVEDLQAARNTNSAAAQPGQGIGEFECESSLLCARNHLVRVLSGHLHHLILCDLIERQGEVTELILFLAAQLCDARLHALVNLFAEITHLVLVAAGEFSHRLLGLLTDCAPQNDGKLCRTAKNQGAA